MRKLIIEEGTENILIEVDATGAYLGDGAILWDEKVDGKLDPSVVLGGLERVVQNGVPSLVVNNPKKAAREAAKAAREQARADRQTAKAAARALLKNAGSVTTAAEVRQVVQALVIALDLDI